MSQVTRTTNELILSSLYLLGELGVGETPDNFMISRGLEILNEILDMFSVDGIYIPYSTTIDFDMVPNQPTYSFSNIVSADVTTNRFIDLVFANYTVEEDSENPIVYPLKIMSKAEYYNVIRLEKLDTRPGFIFMNRQPTETFITLYPAPDQAYPCSIQVKGMLNSLSANEDLTQLPPYFARFLKYALAREFLSYYPSGNWPQTAEQKYQDMYASVKAGNEVDLTLRVSQLLITPQPYYWQTILAY